VRPYNVLAPSPPAGGRQGPQKDSIPFAAMQQRQIIHLGELSKHLGHAALHLAETVLVPFGLFYLLLKLTNLTGAIIAALVWALGALGWRIAKRTPIPSVLLITTALLVARTAVGLATGSVFLYFLQPTLQNFLYAIFLVATVPLRRPLIARLADDFCAFPTTLTERPRVQRFFRRVSLLWALVFMTNGVTTLWALARASLGSFMVVTTAGSYSLVVIAAGASMLWFRRELRGEGIRLRFGGPTARIAVG
jgi:intracellular septation protein A